MTRDARDTYEMFQEPGRGRFGENEERQVRPGRGPKVTGAADLHDCVVELRAEKPLAIAVSDPARPGSPWVWLPKSQIEFERKEHRTIVVTMPGWLAKDKGLI